MLGLIVALAMAPAPDGKTEAMDDWQTMSIVATGTGSDGLHYVRVAAGDLDGDGVADEAIIKPACDGSKLTGASYIVAPRDAATGMASGKRMHKPFTIVKEWGAASPQLSAMKPTYDVKTMKGNEKRVVTSSSAWRPISLSNADGMCAAPLPSSSSSIVKSKSNITNN